MVIPLQLPYPEARFPAPCAPEFEELGRHVGVPPGQQADVTISRCKLGRGVFTNRPFAVGEPVMWFTGRLIDFAEAASRGAHAGNPLQVDWNRYIDSESPGRFINHSCDPNVGLRDSHCLVALRPLPARCQIFMDYSTELWERNWTMLCRCESPRCRKFIIDFDLLPAPVRSLRLQQGIVQPYIVRQLIAQAEEGFAEPMPPPLELSALPLAFFQAMARMA